MVKIYQGENRLNTFKTDAIEVANVKYGLFNVDEWKSVLAAIITEKINEIEIDSDNRQKIESRISTLLTTVIDQFEESYYRKNASSISGFFQGSIASLYSPRNSKTMKRIIFDFWGNENKSIQ